MTNFLLVPWDIKKLHYFRFAKYVLEKIIVKQLTKLSKNKVVKKSISFYLTWWAAVFISIRIMISCRSLDDWQVLVLGHFNSVKFLHVRKLSKLPSKEILFDRFQLLLSSAQFQQWLDGTIFDMDWIWYNTYETVLDIL